MTAAPPPRAAPRPVARRLPRAWGRIPLAFLALVALACLFAYAPVRDSPFLFDDLSNIVENPHVRMTRLDLRSLRLAMEPYLVLNLRPLSFLSFALNHLVGGLDPAGYHAVNLAVLLLSLPAAYLLALHLAGAWLRPRQARALALGATALWALHPLLTGGVSYIVQRMTALYTLFSLAALLLFLRAVRSGGWGTWALAAAALACALASKETALFTPLLALLALWLLPREAGGRGPRAGWALAGAVAASQVAMVFAARHAVQVLWIPPPPFTPAERLLTELRVVLRYLELFLLPLPSRLTLDYAFPLSTSLLSPPATLLAAALHALLIAGALLARRRRPLVAFGVLAFYLLQLPEGTFMPLEIISEHRAYFPAFFLALAAADLLLWGCSRLGLRRPARAALAAATALAALWGGFTCQRNLVWASPVTLWADTAAKAPGNPRALHNLGMAHAQHGDPARAVGPLQEAIRLKPDYVVAITNLGAVYGMLGDLEQAVACYRRAIELAPRYASARFNLGVTLLELGRRDEAVAVWRDLATVNPGLARMLRERIPGAVE